MSYLTTSALPRPWAEIGRIHRRLCFLRWQGRGDEAERLSEGPFTSARDALRAADGEPDFDARLEAALRREEDRALDAIALAEVLLPLLTAPRAAEPPPAAAAQPLPAPGRPVRSAETPSIADFIEEMLVQDRSARVR